MARFASRHKCPRNVGRPRNMEAGLCLFIFCSRSISQSVRHLCLFSGFSEGEHMVYRAASMIAGIIGGTSQKTHSLFRHQLLQILQNREHFFCDLSVPQKNGHAAAGCLRSRAPTLCNPKLLKTTKRGQDPCFERGPPNPPEEPFATENEAPKEDHSSFGRGRRSSASRTLCMRAKDGCGNAMYSLASSQAHHWQTEPNSVAQSSPGLVGTFENSSELSLSNVLP